MKAGMTLFALLVTLVFIAVGFPSPASAQTSPSMGVGGSAPADSGNPAEKPVDATADDWEDESEEIEYIRDPLQPFNRAMFHFNDKLYYWALKPVARGYRFIVPQRARVCVRKFFSNAGTPVRLVNCILQGRMKGAGTEIGRFVVNTTAGIAGLFDPAQKFCGMREQQADFDQTLGKYKMGPVIYINWPLLGPSSLRGTLGTVGDTACDPTTYLLDTWVKLGIAVYEEVNETSLTIGNYEWLTESALDPYIAIRDAYYQNLKSIVESRK